MTNYADENSDVEKVKAEGLKTEEEVKNWAMTHGYGPGMLDDFVKEWKGEPKAVEEVAPAPEPEPEPEPEPVVEEPVAEEVKPAKKSLFGKK